MNIGFIGMGNMAQALVKGWSENAQINTIFAAAKHYDKLCLRAESLGICAEEKVKDVVRKSDWIVIAVKPDVVEDVIGELDLTKPILSVAAGWNCEKYVSVLGESARVQCIMPNLACAFGGGISLFEEENTLNAEEHKIAAALFESCGRVETLPASKINAAMAISGCGPAFAAMAMEALADAGVKYGIPRATAYRLAAQTLIGAGKMQMNTDSVPAQIKDRVCSPGGSTIRGVEALEAHGFRGALFAAVNAVADFYQKKA